jgi:hypothetical protein
MMDNYFAPKKKRAFRTARLGAASYKLPRSANREGVTVGLVPLPVYR